MTVFGLAHRFAPTRLLIRSRSTRHILTMASLVLACLVVPARAGVRFGVEGGLQIAGLRGAFPDLAALPLPGLGHGHLEVSNREASATGELGLVLEVPLRGPWAVTGGLAYAPLIDTHPYEYGYESGNSHVTETGDLRTHLRMMTLPVRLEWRHGAGRLGLGPEVRYLVAAERDLHDVDKRIIGVLLNLADPGGGRASAYSFHFPAASKFTVDGDVTDRYERWSLAASAVAGLEKPLRRQAVRCDLRWIEGLTNVSKSPGVTQRTRAVQLVVGLLW
jgi:hypothetical protein